MIRPPLSISEVLRVRKLEQKQPKPKTLYEHMRDHKTLDTWINKK